MENAFAFSVAMIFRDPNMSRAALYRPGGEGDGATVRVILNAPDAVANFGNGAFVVDATALSVQVAEVASPKSGDTFELDDGTVLEVGGDPKRDRERLCWAMGAREL
ncbi:head-tail joining protein [Paenirhodobacter enshiensis]|uniref:Uncharacterized protein n=1 Tax=Paenirhodobacter enshiensis TaxID=1105367 RepID=A0A086XQQ5_9RHOB|nr:hypothetical protein [Paenirhodobacter enshiensis]KFI24355.1 hypothetical protein CG50_10660 [Paenirhodobacter enshiensis]